MNKTRTADFEQQLLQHFDRYPPLSAETVLLVARHWLRIGDEVTVAAIQKGRLAVQPNPSVKSAGS